MTAASSGMPYARYRLSFVMSITGLLRVYTRPSTFLAIMFGRPLVVNSLGYSYLAGCYWVNGGTGFYSGLGG